MVLLFFKCTFAIETNKNSIAFCYKSVYAVAVKRDGNCEKEFFVMPEERTVTIDKFFRALDDHEEYPGVFYVQKQNSNLSDDFPELLGDCETHVPWASDAFGCMPDAVNLWIGDGRAITSMHKDPYENIYCVVSGCKHFILLPPTDRPWIPYKRFPTAVYKEKARGHFDIVPTSEENAEVRTEGSIEDIAEHSSGLSCSSEEPGSLGSFVPWICIDPLQPDLESYPLYKNASPVKVSVEAGDALYLPSLWYHHVQQSHGCIAVNFWYNMQFDVKYAYHQMLEALSSKCLSS
ncbi:bifunctional peptidase and (3S)-lysyl hydroxylase Jmjd7-like isoform X2 [Bacillus rossius redtenbacheri]|uniref:bifunctional peptidase and (3S)-lysyl hydroxylase Jmjd7-like isoform X2 n=1 Tax=Bacillus rossius redtenbacheri TaxID=93214 RepID=UPI002FDE4274